jgi:mono/diheme cytochrome c family protein
MKRKLIIVPLFISFLAVALAFVQTNKWAAPPQANKLLNPLQNNAVATTEGSNIFKKQCVICHGNEGKGDGMVGMSLNPRPSNLQAKEVSIQSDGAIFWKITTGNSPMPSYKINLSEQQRWQLVDYIRKLQQK